MESVRKFTNWIKEYIRTGNISVLIFIPLIFGFSIVLISTWVFGPRNYPSRPYNISTILFAFFPLIGSLSGIVQIYRRETYGPFGKPIYGIWPVISGIVWVIFCLIVFIAMVIVLIFNLE